MEIIEKLKQLNIPYELIEHPAVYTVKEAKSIVRNIEGVECKNLFLESKKFQNLFIAMTQKDLESLQNNPVLFNVTKQYLQFLMVALEKRVAIEEAKKLNDTQILDFLMKQNKLKVLKDILDKETARIKRLRPDIVKSWKSYQAFEKLCKDNNIA